MIELCAFILNDRVFQWLFLPSEPVYYLKVFVRRYIQGDIWIPQGCQAEFTRQRRLFIETPDSEGEVFETYYRCVNPFIAWDQEGFPVLRS